MHVPEKDKLALKRSVLGLGTVLVRNEVRLPEKTNRDLISIPRSKSSPCF